MTAPSYHEDNIVNLMASVLAALGGEPEHPTLGILPPTELGDAQNVVLVVIDGLGYRFLARHPESFLNRHIRGRLSSVFPSTTAAAITSLTTGLTPRQHGITGWFTYLREIGSVAAILPFRPRHGGLPYSRMGIKPHEIYTWRPISHRFSKKVESVLITGQDLLDSDYTRAISGTRRVGYSSQQEFFWRIGEQLRETGPRRYVYAYWPGLDELAHQYGVGSDEVVDHFRDLDRSLEQLVDEIQGQKTTLLIAADHGVIDTTPDRTFWLKDHPELAATLTLPLCGDPRAAYCYVHPAQKTEFERYVAEQLADCCRLLPAEQLLAEGYFGPGPEHPRLRERIGDFVLLMRDNYAIRDRVLGESPTVQIGVHGGVSDDERYVPLVVCKG